MQILFAGTPQIAVPSLELLSHKFKIVGVLTNPDRPKGRGRKMVFSEVKAKALELELPLLQPEKLDEPFLDEVRALKADLLVTFAFGRIFKKDFLDLFPMGAVNLHPSRLPQYRGPSPLSAAVDDGLEVSAVTVQKMALKMDSGDILIQEDMPLDPRETTGTLTEKASLMAPSLLLKALNQLEQGIEEARPQKEGDASYCKILKKEEGRVDWNGTVKQIDRRIRSCSPWPGAFTAWREQILYIREAHPYEGEMAVPGGEPGRVLGVDKKAGILVETGEGILAISQLQLQSRKNLDFLSFLNGNREFLNSQLGD